MKNVTESKDSRDKAQNALSLIIEGKLYHWHEQYVTGAQIKKLAGISQDAELFLSISNPWEDEQINNEKEVDLARQGTEQFFIRKALRYTINGKEFSSNKQFIKGSFIREQGKILPSEDIYLKVSKDWDDELIEDDEWVDLARPGKEHFESKNFKICIIVNLRQKEWISKKISYDQIVTLAFPDYDAANKSYTVKYTDGPKQNSEGSMSAGDTLYVKNKMTFHVTATNKS